MPQGLTDDAVALLENAEHNGVDIGTVNIMAMDYGSSYTGDMGDYAVRAATAPTPSCGASSDCPRPRRGGPSR